MRKEADETAAMKHLKPESVPPHQVAGDISRELDCEGMQLDGTNAWWAARVSIPAP